MGENRKIEVDMDFVKKLYKIAELKTPPAEEITLDKLKHLADAIEDFTNRLRFSAREQSDDTEVLLKAVKTDKNRPDVLIIDDLCIITYQLGVLFKNLGYNVTVAKDINDAIAKFKEIAFDLVVMDLFIPTEKEGVILLDELLKLRANGCHPCRIGVMTASSKEEHKTLCSQKGADFFVEKTENWQKALVLAAKG